MKKGLLERLYWAYSNSEVSAEGSLSDLYEHTRDAKRAEANFSEKLYATDLPHDAKSLLEDIGCSVSDAKEIQGFINGFRLGMKLAEEVYGGGEG